MFHVTVNVAFFFPHRPPAVLPGSHAPPGVLAGTTGSPRGKSTERGQSFRPFGRLFHQEK